MLARELKQRRRQHAHPKSTPPRIVRHCQCPFLCHSCMHTTLSTLPPPTGTTLRLRPSPRLSQPARNRPRRRHYARALSAVCYALVNRPSCPKQHHSSQCTPPPRLAPLHLPTFLVTPAPTSCPCAAAAWRGPESHGAATLHQKLHAGLKNAVHGRDPERAWRHVLQAAAGRSAPLIGRPSGSIHRASATAARRLCQGPQIHLLHADVPS